VSVWVRDEAGQESSHESALVVNCTGPRAGFSETDIPLYRNLIERGLVRSDELDMGIDVATDFAVLDAEGEKSKLLFTIGPLMRGSLLETTAVPELRGQARRGSPCRRRSAEGEPGFPHVRRGRARRGVLHLTPVAERCAADRNQWNSPTGSMGDFTAYSRLRRVS
jgi:hypothetical protein